MDIEYLGPLDRRENYDPEVVRAALKYGIDPDLAVSVHRQEYSPDMWISSAGARGPMQLMPGTARELGVDPDDPQQNIDGGVRYLGQMLKAFGGDQVLALAAYNAGPERVKAGTLPIETRRYTRDVIFRAKRLRQAAPEIEYLGPLEEEAPEIEYLGPLEEDLGPVGSNVVRKPIPEPGEEAPGTLRRAWEKFKELALPDDVGAAEIPAEAQARGVAAPTIDLSGARPMITVTPPEAGAATFDEASLYRPMVRKPIPLGQGMGAASAEDEPEIEYLGPLEGYEEPQPPDVGQSFKNVGSKAAESFNRGTASLMSKLDDVATWISESTGLPKGGLYEAARREYDKNADYWNRQSENPTLTEEIMGEFLGGAIPGMADFLTGTGVSALHGYSKDGIKGALKEGAERFLLGQALHSMQPLKPITRGAAFGSLNTAQTAAQGGSPEEIAKSAGVGFGLGATGGPGKKGVKEALLDATFPARDLYRPEFSEIQNIANRLEQLPTAKVLPDSIPISGNRQATVRLAIDFYKSKGKPVVTNLETGNRIIVAPSGIKNSLQHGIGPEKVAVISELDRLLETSTLIVRDSNNMKPGVAAVETYAGKAEIGGSGFIARLVVRETRDGRRFYDHELSSLNPIKSERPDSASGGSSGSFSASSRSRPLPSLGKRVIDEALNVKSKLKDESGFITTEPLKAIVPKIQKVHDYVTIDPLPAMTRHAPRAADAAVEHAAARIAVPHEVKKLLTKVFPDSYRDPKAMARTIDILNKDNVLAGWDAFRKRTIEALEAARKEADPAKKAELLKEADAWDNDAHAIAREHDVDAYKTEIGDLIAKAYGGDPNAIDVIGNIQRWKQHVNPFLDQLYNEAKRVDKWTPREDRGMFFGARINLTTKERAAELADILRNRGYQLRPLPGPSIGANYRNPNVKHDRFMRQAKFTGDYSTDAELALFNVLGPRWNEVTKIRMFEGLKKSGVAVETDPGMSGPANIQGQDVTRLAVKLPMTGTDGRTRQVERALWVRQDLAREVRQVLGTDMPMEQNPVARVLTQIQLAQIADAVTHSKNLLTVVTRAQGAGSVWKDVVRRVPVFGTMDAVVRIGQVAREVMSDSPAIREEIANLAKLGVIRPDYPSTGLQKITRAQDFLHKLDQGTRIVMNRFFDNLVERGLVVDTPKNRRDYINQCGQYNGRLQGQFMNAFKQSGMSPFIVAGRNFNRQGIRGITGNPGIQATTAGAALEMRAINWLGTALTLSAVPMMLNTLTTGSPAGRSGTPLGAWDLGTEENEKGKHRVIDLAQISGLRRGMRVTGADAVVAGMKAGHTSNQIAGKILEDVTRNVMHPWIGPAPSGALKALTGRQLDIRGYMEAHKVPEGGGLQVLENVRAALESQNPLVYSMVRPVFEAAGLERLPEKPYGENIVATFLKSPYGAFGVKDVYPERSAALEMASTMMSGRMPEGTTPEQREKMRVKKEFGRAVRTGKPVDEELRERAKRLLSTTDLKTMGKRLQFDELQNKVKSLTSEEALKVFEVATSEERAGIVAIVAAKLARGLKNASPVERERLLEQLKRVRKRVFEDQQEAAMNQ